MSTEGSKLDRSQASFSALRQARRQGSEGGCELRVMRGSPLAGCDWEMKVPRSGRSKRNAGSRCFSVEVNEGCRCREQWHGAGELWRPGLTFASVLFTLSLAWVAVLWSFKSTTDSRQSPSDSPGFLAVEEGSTSSSGDVTSTESIGHAPVIPPVMVDQAELGMLPKAAPSAAPTARAAAPTARAAAPTARSAAQAAALAAPGAGDLRSLTAELAKKVHGPQAAGAIGDGCGWGPIGSHGVIDMATSQELDG
eukprot:Skav215610  [mRNA]  locus=scaffold666:514640:525423:- [translate_table: standard]